MNKNKAIILIMQFLLVVIPLALYVLSEREWVAFGIIGMLFAAILLVVDIVYYFRNERK